MRIVIDARESGTSTGRYIDKLVEHLHNQESDFEFIILTKPERLEFFNKVAPDFRAVGSRYKEFSFGEQLGLRRQIKSLKPDLVHFGMTQQPVLYRGRVVTTIHDLTTARFINPAKFAPVFKIKQVIYRGIIKVVAKKSLKLITPSQFVKADVAQYAKIDPSKIKVIYEAADKITVEPTSFTSLKGKPFLFYVGRALPHKNLKRLIDAFELLSPKYPKLRLILAGQPGANYERIKRYAHAKSASKFSFIGRVNDGQLRWLYKHCEAYVFPSLSEGFGLPGLEAMTHGAPVLAARATSLPEIYGPAAHYFNPNDTIDMAARIGEVLDSRELRDSLTAAGRIQASKYSWAKAAEQTLQVYRSALR